GGAAQRVAVGQRDGDSRVDHAVDLEQLLPHRLLEAEHVKRLLLRRRGGETFLLEDLAHGERLPPRKALGVQHLHRAREVVLGDPHLPTLLVRRKVLVRLDPRAKQRRHHLVGLLLLEVAVQRRAAAAGQRQAGQQQGQDRQALVGVRRFHAAPRLTTAAGDRKSVV